MVTLYLQDYEEWVPYAWHKTVNDYRKRKIVQKMINSFKKILTFFIKKMNLKKLSPQVKISLIKTWKVLEFKETVSSGHFAFEIWAHSNSRKWNTFKFLKRFSVSFSLFWPVFAVRMQKNSISNKMKFYALFEESFFFHVLRMTYYEIFYGFCVCRPWHGHFIHKLFF